MEINVWGWLFSETDRLLLKQRCPEVAVFRGCQLDGWYHSTSGGQFMRRRNATITGVLELFRTNAIYQAYDLASGADPPQDHEVDENIPCAILRRRGSNTLRGRGVMDMPQSTVLTLRALTDLLQRALQGAESRDRDVWSVQTIVKPSEDLRVLSVYNCDANGTEKSEIFGRSYTKLYNGDYSSFQLPTEREAGEDGFKPVLAARMAEVEAKTLSVVRFASRFHSLECEGLVLEFVFDAAGHAVLHGCWCCSLFGPSERRKIRSGSLPKHAPKPPSREGGRSYPVPSPSAYIQVPAPPEAQNPGAYLSPKSSQASIPQPPQRNASVGSMKRTPSEVTPLPQVDFELAPDEPCVVVELWRGDEFVGEAVLPTSQRVTPGSEKGLRLQAAGSHCWPMRPDRRRSQGAGGAGGTVFVSMDWVPQERQQPLLRLGVLRAERLPRQASTSHAAPRALVWKRSGGASPEFSALYSSCEATPGQGFNIEEMANWNEVVDLNVEGVDVGGVAAAPKTYNAGAPKPRSHSEMPMNVQHASDVVCGAALKTHWGMSEEDGTMRTTVLVDQVNGRLKSERFSRSVMLQQLSGQLHHFCELQRAWEDELKMAKVSVGSAATSLKEGLGEVQRQRAETSRVVADCEARLASTCKELCGLVDEHRLKEHSDDVELANSKMRIEEQRTMVHQLVDRSHALQASLDRTVRKFDEVSSSYAQVQGDVIRSQVVRPKSPREREQDEQHVSTAQMIGLNAEVDQEHQELTTLRGKLSKLQDQMAAEKSMAMRMEDFVHRVAAAPPARLRRGGGFVLDATAKREASALLQEMGMRTVEEQH